MSSISTLDADKYALINPYIRPESFIQARDNILSHEKYTNYLFFRGNDDNFRKFCNSLSKDESYDDFNDKTLIKYLYDTSVLSNIDSIKINGLENIKKTGSYIFISTHRDIVLDCVILNCELFKRGYKIISPVVGSNLIFSDFASSCFALLRSIIVRRSLPPREVYEQSMLLSSLLFDMMSKNTNSVWIAGGAGRSKDGRDMVRNVVVKMLYLSRGKKVDFAQLLDQMPLIPVTISYQKDPGDILKAHQLSTPGFVKTQNDDIFDIQKGILQPKGQVEINISPAVKPHDGMTFDTITSLIQREFHRAYKLFNYNYLAYDIVFGKGEYSKYYSPEDKEYFRRFSHLPPSMRDKVLMYYANPVIMRRECEKA